MHKNIKLLYLILPTTMAWFWLGVWVLYYLRITNYAGIGLIEMAQITAGFVLEIPTGGIADLLGKKKTLIIALGLMTLGNLAMAISTSLTYLILSVIVISAGYAFSSGTTEALLFDSLKQVHKDNKFSFHLSRIEALKLLTLAIASITGGFIYRLNPALPFTLTALATGLGMICCFLLQEPEVDSDKFSWTTYKNILTRGLTELMSQSKQLKIVLSKLFIMLLTITITYEVLDGALAIDFGLNATSLGIFFACVSVGAAITTQLFEKFTSNNSRFSLDIFYGLIILTVIFSPWYGLVAGITSILVRELVYPLIRIHASSVINHAVESKYRATTLSTFTMFTKTPYLLFAYFVGRLMDATGARNVAFVTAIGCGVLFVLNLLFEHLTKNHNSYLDEFRS